MDAEKSVVLVPDSLSNLTVQAQRFSEYYASSGVPHRAAILAGYSATSALAHSYRLLDDPRIQDAVAYYREVHASTSLYTPEKITQQWSNMASFDILECCNDDYSLKNISELTPDQRKALGVALVGLKIVERNGKRYVEAKLARETALQELGRINRMYADDKTQAQGLTLIVNLTQQITTSDAAQEEENIGYLRITSEPGT